MDFPDGQVLCNFMADNEAAPMETDKSNIFDEEGEENDQFLKFIDYAKSILCQDADDSHQNPENSPSWSWIASRILKTCAAYSSGVTPAILLSELFLAWNEQNKVGAPKKQSEVVVKLKESHKRAKLANTVTIDSIYEKKFLSLNSVIEAVILDTFTLPGTNIYMLTLGDIWSSHTINLYLHRRFYSIADPKNGILKKGREVFLTGCYLRSAMGGSDRSRLLPTEYFVVLLDEDQDDDAMLLGAQFCSDSFSSISLDAAKNGMSYSLYARIEHIGALEILRDGSLKRKQVKLVDNDGASLNFVLWGEQNLVANLFSVGSLLALDMPYISNGMDGCNETDEIVLEYGSSTQLYLVPLILQKEQVSVALTQSHLQASRQSTASNPSQCPTISQVTLPCDSRGSIDFSNCPFRLHVIDLRDKMTGISLYATVTDIRTSGTVVSLRIEDTTGGIWANLHVNKSWSQERFSMGHIVYISGLSSLVTPQKNLVLSWYENDSGALFFNISCMPAFLNTSCLHSLTCLSDLPLHTRRSQVCQVWVDQIDYCNVETKLLHRVCGHLVDTAPSGDLYCKFCHSICNPNTEVERTFDLKLTLADNSAKIFAWCIGQTAAEMLQISPDEFAELPEEEQIMYPSSLEQDKFIVAIVNCRRQGAGIALTGKDQNTVNWEITRAMKCE